VRAPDDHAIPVPPPDLTIAICTHNPRRDVLARTLESLRNQIAPGLRLALLVVDNASNPPLTDAELGLDQFPFPARVCPEPELGLTPARWRAFQEASGDLLLYVDDDNFLEPNYAAEVVGFFSRNPRAGVVGGRTLALPETPLPSWMTEQLLSHLAVRDPGDAPIRFLDDQTPYGAGMALRRTAMRAARVDSAVFSDRKGNHLSSFGDSELCYRIRIAGWELWYEPKLKLQHFLSAHRLRPEYYLRFLETMGRDWPKLEFFWSPGTPWRRLSYLKRAASLWLKWLRSPAVADPDERVRTEFQRAFDRGLRRSLVRLAFGPALWRGVPSLTPGQ
jgi:glycosyltransferase involved in cell wall biosynthesis